MNETWKTGMLENWKKNILVDLPIFHSSILPIRNILLKHTFLTVYNFVLEDKLNIH